MNVLVRDMDLALPKFTMRLEILADGLPVWRCTTGGGHHSGVSHSEQWVCQTWCRRQTALPWLRHDATKNAPIRSWLVPKLVHASWSSLGKSEAVGQRAKARAEPLILQKRVEQA